MSYQNEADVLKCITTREYINTFFSYNETIDIYHTVDLLKKLQDKNDENNTKSFLQPKFDDINIVFENQLELVSFLDKCIEGLEMIGNPQIHSMYSLYILQMGLFDIKDHQFEGKEARLAKSRFISNLLCTNI